MCLWFVQTETRDLTFAELEESSWNIEKAFLDACDTETCHIKAPFPY
jgi:hypothetical protein